MKKLWDTLKSRYVVVNGPKIQQLKSLIAKCEQTKNMAMSEYFGKLYVGGASQTLADHHLHMLCDLHCWNQTRGKKRH